MTAKDQSLLTRFGVCRYRPSCLVMSSSSKLYLRLNACRNF
ncbi:uncharacterized protein QC764_0107130 [Podospora pseudoanserina]|uniref:Uncharacterized protein n=1 Tax=Podospora pseudoanserina TaxID=2609844 RepID=A0ABR0HLF1_9PEZI|nr:hypothetical protein QC764_0107130 [Podospora pseudoanserina]